MYMRNKSHTVRVYVAKSSLQYLTCMYRAVTWELLYTIVVLAVFKASIFHVGSGGISSTVQCTLGP